MMLFRFARSFILLLLFLGVMTTVSFYLYKKYEETTLQIHKIIYDDLIDDQGQLFENYIAYLQDDMGDKIISNFKKYPMIRAHYERDLANLLTDEVKYLYVLYFDGDKLRYLIDTEKDPQERADINQKFDPQSSIWIDAKNQKKPQTLVQKNLESLWVSYAHPIIVNDKVVAVLGADFSYDEFQTIEEAVAPLNRLFLYMSIFMLMMLLSAYIQFYLYYKTRKRSLIDPLTNIYNRQYLVDFLQDSVINHYQIMMIDLDHFKNINDHYGHDIGDKVLKKATQRIAKTIRNNDVLIRFGGEEFLLFIRESSDVTASEIAWRINKAIKERPFEFQEHAIDITVSIGVNPYPSHAKNIDEAIKIADEQLYLAKTGGRDRVCVLEAKDHTQSQKTVKIIDVKEALEEERICCHYQPIFNTDGLKVNKYEVLVRIMTRENELIFPNAFLSAISHTRVYRDLTKHILEVSLAKLREDKRLQLSINLDLQDLFNDELMRMIEDAFVSNEVLLKRLCIEILEYEEITSFELIKSRIARLKHFGVNIALDDFGSGYANFNYLIHLGIDQLKIDGSLVRDLDKNKGSYIIVKTIINFAKDMNIKTIAEQVETQAEFDALCELGVDMLQGYLLAKPKAELF